MAINFPNSPSLGQLYNFSGTTWQWSGEYWNVYSAQTGYITSVSTAGSGFPVIQSVTSNALTLKSFSGTNITITDNAGQLNFFVPLNGGGGGQLYYFNISETQTPYYELATSATSASEQSITSAVTSGNTVSIGKFLTPLGYPNVSIIPGGVWSFYLHAYKQNSSASFDMYCDVYKRTTGGSETLLFSTDPAPVTSNSPTPSMLLTDVYFSGGPIDITDRLVVDVRATNTSNATYSVTFVSEGAQHYSYVSSPLLLRVADIYVNSFSYTPSANTLTIGQTENFSPLTAIINEFSGLTITSGLTVNTISAATYQNLPAVNAVTGGSYNSSTGVITLSGTGSVNGNTITGFSTGSGGLTWQFATSSITAVTNNGYITTGTTSIALPTTATLGSTIEVVSNTTSLFTITQNSNQFIRFGIISTTPTSGTFVSQNIGDSIRLLCTSANTVFTVVSAVGTFTLN